MPEIEVSLFDRLKRHPMVKSATAYAATAFVVVQVVELISGSFELKQDDVDVYWKPYPAEEDTWEFLGTIPLEVKALPVGPLQIRLEKKGYLTAYLSLSNPGMSFKNFPVALNWVAAPLELVSEEDIPEGMVYVPGGPFMPAISGEIPQPYVLSPYYIDKYEVTNKQFKEFVEV